MIGTFVNVGAIILCGLIAKFTRWEVPAAKQNMLKVLLGVLLIVFGFMGTWDNLHGSFGSIVLQFVGLLLCMSFGRLIGAKLGLQKRMTKLAVHAQNLMQRSDKTKSANNDAFLIGSILFCTGPLSIPGAFLDGLNDPKTLIIKAIMDGLAVLAFVRMLGFGIVFSFLPVLALQGTIVLGIAALIQRFELHPSISLAAASSGLLVVTSAVLVLDVRKVPVADYLPSIALAAAMGFLF